jgi:hypothetical protein
MISDKAFRTIKQTLRNLTPRRSPRPLADVIGEVNAALRGWTYYFRHALAGRKAARRVRRAVRGNGTTATSSPRQGRPNTLYFETDTGDGFRGAWVLQGTPPGSTDHARVVDRRGRVPADGRGVRGRQGRDQDHAPVLKTFMAVQIRAGQHIITGEDPLPTDLRDALAHIT